jgi:serine/threonine-protein kinase RsbW
MTDRFSLELPPEPISIGTARLFSATVARFFGCAEEAVEDLKLAVSEACTAAIRANEAAGRRVSVSIEGGMRLLTFAVGDGGSAAQIGEDEVPLPAAELIRALFPEVEVVANARGGQDVRFSVPTAG